VSDTRELRGFLADVAASTKHVYPRTNSRKRQSIVYSREKKNEKSRFLVTSNFGLGTFSS